LVVDAGIPINVVSSPSGGDTAIGVTSEEGPVAIAVAGGILIKDVSNAIDSEDTLVVLVVVAVEKILQSPVIATEL
jgi:hypothetical protein